LGSDTASGSDAKTRELAAANTTQESETGVLTQGQTGEKMKETKKLFSREASPLLLR